MTSGSKDYYSHPWSNRTVRKKGPTPADVLADRDKRLATRDPIRSVLGDPPPGYRRTELRYVPAPSINPTLGIGVVTRERPGQTGNLRLARVSLPRISILEG